MLLAFWYSPSVGFWQIINTELYVGLLETLRKEPHLYPDCMLCLMEVDQASAQEIDLSVIKPHPCLTADDPDHYDGPHS